MSMLVDKFVVIPAQSFVVQISSDREGLSEDELISRRAILVAYLVSCGLKYDICEGHFTGKDGVTVSEQSFCVEVHHPDVARNLACYMVRFEQECVLIINQMAQAYLVSPQAKSFIALHIGKWGEIPKCELNGFTDYTVFTVGDKKRYFAVKKVK